MMPELDIVHFWYCRTQEDWHTTVPSSSGNGEYLVSYGRDYRMGGQGYDYRCSCPGYKYHGGKYCRHIRQIIAEERRCAWNQFMDGGEPVNNNGVLVCPECGGPVTSAAHGV